NEIFPATTTVAFMLEQIEKRGFHFDRIERPHHTTHDLTLKNGFKIRIEDEPLINKIKREEMSCGAGPGFAGR
ncbi:MAG: hypothetical protein AAB664_04655, partial [Patescibacteria group bacterium]